MFTKPPSGLSIARDGLTFTCSWKNTDKDYDEGLEFEFVTNRGNVDYIYTDLDSDTTSQTVTLNASAGRLDYVGFSIRGKRAGWIDDSGDAVSHWWSDTVGTTFLLEIPNDPVVTAELDSALDNVTLFSWNVETSNTDSKHFDHIEWQTTLVRACNTDYGEYINWNGAAAAWSYNSSGTIPGANTTEDPELLAYDSYTRWVRVRSVGIAGASPWIYAHHVYAKPYTPNMVRATATKTGITTTCKVVWTLAEDCAHPVDSVSVQYLSATPTASGLVPPAAGSWESMAAFRNTSNKDAAQFSIDNMPGEDECLWVRVVANHDHSDNNSFSEVMRMMVGTLAAPEFADVITNITLHRATITAVHNSEVPDSKIAVLFRNGKTERTVGIMDHNVTDITLECPAWNVSDEIEFGLYEFQGTYFDTKAATDSVHRYTVNANMKSSTVWYGGYVPMVPSSFSGQAASLPGEVLLIWDYPWIQANRSELSWSKNPNAWESTDEPSTYIVTNENAGKWRVSGLETGATWYFRVRLGREVNGVMSWGPYTDNIAIDLSAAPNVPVLSVSSGIITVNETVTASWSYESTDGTAQTYAEVREATVSGTTVTIGELIAKTETAQHIDIKGSQWTVGTTHYIVVRVTSSSGKNSEWSDPVSITVADPITCEITDTSLVETTVTADDGGTRTVLSLTEMPFTATIEGAGDTGTTTLVIERSADYHMVRPDNAEVDGYKGETIALIRQEGEDEISVGLNDLIGLLDDGAPYRMIAVTQDSFGQTASDVIEFEVHWTHQAEVPTAVIEITEDGIAKITPTAPDSAEEGDVCDIYRISTDGIELIVKDGEYGETYVDPYPAIGENGGHRIVHRTINGDYITGENRPAWVDFGKHEGDILDVDYAIIDFGGDQVRIEYEMILDNTWEKDFQKTVYLGGAVKGDWNENIQRSGNITAAIPVEDMDVILALRRLSQHTGICHVRTQDGSSYAANVQVGDGLSHEKAGRVLEYTLTITGVDPEGYEGVTLEQWQGGARGATGATGATGET